MNTLKHGTLRMILLGGLVAAALAAAPGVGQAAAPPVGGSVGVVGNKVLYEGAGSAHNSIEVMRGTNGILVMENNPNLTLAMGSGCARINDYLVNCPVMGALEVNLGDGNDTFTVGGPQALFMPITVNGGRGDDRYQGGRDPGPSRVTFIGGANFDTADYSRATSRVLVDLGTQAGNDADDGRPANVDADNIHSDVEGLIGSDFDDSLRGNEADNQILGGKGRDALRGGPGDDTLFAHVTGPPPNYIVTPEADSNDLSCGTGTDRIYVDSADPAASECEDRVPV
ncbi:calcium-binding protein [Nonomuraea basaltis]|uniref:calcium-binding protein n=1 Tax=Nonomuraea basaltis TaxID=2495887 RepID=UPI00110C543C|nr:calcium-binding protein [Nonomuraea basaltis]TMR91335.1 calcium-binding protein [Nonomuraea basaltis]